MTINHCIGCSAYIFDDSLSIISYCSFRKYNDNGTCPCSECVVKMMCNDPCSGFFLCRDYAVTKERTENYD